jgi:hypothetical protein
MLQNERGKAVRRGQQNRREFHRANGRKTRDRDSADGREKGHRLTFIRWYGGRREPWLMLRFHARASQAVTFVAAATLAQFCRPSYFHRAICRRLRHYGRDCQIRRHGDDEQAIECAVEGSHGSTTRCVAKDKLRDKHFSRQQSLPAKKSGNCGCDCAESAILAAALCVFAQPDQATSAAVLQDWQPHFNALLGQRKANRTRAEQPGRLIPWTSLPNCKLRCHSGGERQLRGQFGAQVDRLALPNLA